MITLFMVVERMPGLEREDLERWIDNDWVRPDQQAGQFLFRDIDVARVRLICDLRDDLEVNDAALPVVLSLLDEVYELRRRFRAFGRATCELVPAAIQSGIAERMSKALTASRRL